MPSFLVCWKKIPQTGWLKTIEIYSLTEALEENMFLASLLVSTGCWPSLMLLVYSSIPLICAFVFMWPSILCVCVCVCAYVCVSAFHPTSKDTSHNGFRAHPNPVWHLGLITSAKTLSARKLTFTDSKFIMNWRDTLVNPAQCLFGKCDHRLTLQETWYNNYWWDSTEMKRRIGNPSMFSKHSKLLMLPIRKGKGLFLLSTGLNHHLECLQDTKEFSHYSSFPHTCFLWKHLSYFKLLY